MTRASDEATQIEEASRFYFEALDSLAVLGGCSILVSAAQTGLPTDKRGELASMVFGKMCATVRSMGAIAKSSMHDHSGLLSLARIILEASTMTAYLMQTVSQEEWDARYLVLKLHDTAARIRIMKGFDGHADDLRAGMRELKEELGANVFYKALPSEKRERLMRCNDPFVSSFRRVSKEAMGWSDNRLDGVYAYISSHVHSSPVSFFRMRHHGVDYYEPSAAQFGASTFAVNLAVVCLRRILIRRIDEHPEKSPVQPDLLREWREQDAKEQFFGS